MLWEEMTPNQRREQFISDNGDCVVDGTGQYHIFSTGAMCDRNVLGVYMSPATEVNLRRGIDSRDVQRTLRNKLYYAQKKLGGAIRAFEDMEKKLESQAKDAVVGLAVDPTPDEIDSLHQARAEAKRFEAMAEAAELELNPPRPQSQQPCIDPVARAKSQAILEDIQKIEV